MAFDSELALKVAEKAVSTLESGVKLDLTDTNEAYQLAFSIVGLAMYGIPVAGAILGSLLVVLSQVLFPAKTLDPWDKVRERVEQLIGTKIQESQIKLLQAKIKGFELNIENFKTVLKDFNALEGEAKVKQGQMLRMHFTSFTYVMRTAIPEFQIEEYAVAALPAFAQAVNIYMLLLSDGIKNGVQWGFEENYIANTLRAEFDKMTSSGKSARGLSVEKREDNEDLELLKAAIDAGEQQGWPQELLTTWKEAYAIMIEQFATQTRRAIDQDYVAHVRKYYDQGRKQVKPYKWDEKPNAPYFGNGHKEALALQAVADYDMEMMENVLHYAEMWPFLSGAEVPESTELNLDKEVFRGPYSRYTENSAWSVEKPAPATKRTERITGVRLCVSEDVLSLQVKYGEAWGTEYGLCRKPEKEAEEFELGPDEYIENVNVAHGHKLGSLQFITNKGTIHGPFGKGLHAEPGTLAVNRTGYALTSMYPSHYERHDPEGLEGIILGFRPLVFAKKD
ncbi:Delta endotoxin central region subgroup 1 [Cordyceps javanica]|nr:Delta endotoxin central region subgroup 1 [Cordyceps javanica]